jgi:hypothetical protein
MDLLDDLFWMEAPFFLAIGVIVGLNVIVGIADWVKRKITRRERYVG